jgi:hypothetical protein
MDDTANTFETDSISGPDCLPNKLNLLRSAPGGPTAYREARREVRARFRSIRSAMLRAEKNYTL